MKIKLARILFGWWRRLLTTEEQFDMVRGFTVGLKRPEYRRWAGAPNYVFKEKKK